MTNSSSNDVSCVKVHLVFYSIPDQIPIFIHTSIASSAKVHLLEIDHFNVFWNKIFMLVFENYIETSFVFVDQHRFLLAFKQIELKLSVK